MKKPTIAVYAPHYLPGFKAGGPIPSLANMIEALGDEFDFRVITSDRDLGDAEPYPGTPRDQWTPVGKGHVWYVGEAWPDVGHAPIYLNSFFHPTFTLKPLLRRRPGKKAGPVLLAPRGEFSEGAYNLKGAKKRVFVAISKLLGLHRGVTFHASSGHEAADIRRVLGPVKIGEAMDIAGSSRKVWPDPDNPALSVAFFSRLSPKKNLIGAIEIMAGIRSPASLTVYGPIEDAAYWDQCKAAADRLPEHVGFSYGGPLTPPEVEGALAKHDLFLFPTLGENYGHVIREALSAGLPALLSDTTPWRALGDAGAALPLSDPTAFSRWIDDFAALPPKERGKRRAAARAKGDNEVERRASVEATRLLLKSYSGETASPQSVVENRAPSSETMAEAILTART